MGKPAVIVDTSLDSPEEVAAAAAAAAAMKKTVGDNEIGDVKNADEAAASADDAERLGDRAFDNLTDLENEDFVFVY